MLLLKTIGLLLSISVFAAAERRDFWPESANMNANIGNFSVSIKTDSFKEILNSNKSLSYRYFWSKDKDFLDCSEPSICPILLNKIKILTGDNLNKFLEKYVFVEKDNGWHKYKDGSGAEDYSDVSIKYENDMLYIIQKNPTGTEYINYTFKKDEHGLALTTVEHKSYVGLQKFRTITTLEYGKLRKLRFPTKVIMATNQSLITKDIKTPKRKVREIYDFTDYKINDKSNLERLSRSK